MAMEALTEILKVAEDDQDCINQAIEDDGHIPWLCERCLEVFDSLALHFQVDPQLITLRSKLIQLMMDRECYFCSQQRGALLKVSIFPYQEIKKKGRKKDKKEEVKQIWCHAECVNFSNLVWFKEDDEERDKVEGYTTEGPVLLLYNKLKKLTSKDQKQAQCSECKKLSFAYCMCSCDINSCREMFHASCAIRSEIIKPGLTFI